MNPDKLFNYLDGRLSASERAELEARLIADTQLQRELAVARRIHAGMGDGSREMVLPEADVADRGRKMALRVGVVFIILMAVNVGAGLWVIAHREGKNPNRKLLETQKREQIVKSLEHAAASAFTTPSLGVNDMTISARSGQMEVVADEIVATARRLGGSAAKGIHDQDRIRIDVDLPADREAEFRGALSAISGGVPAMPSPNETPAQSSEKKNFVIHIVESASTVPQ